MPFFVLIDPVDEPVSAIVCQLDRGECREAVRSQDGRLKMARPFPVEVDLAGTKT